MSNTEVVLTAGQVAPAFSAQNQDGETISSAQLFQKNTVLYFFPTAGTPGCTKEAADFQDHLPEFESRGYQVVGISPDSVKRLKHFEENHELEFILLSDPETQLHRLYGAHGEKTIFGRLYKGILRSTILVKDGMVTHALYNVKATGHIANLLRLIDQ